MNDKAKVWKCLQFSLVYYFTNRFLHLWWNFTPRMASLYDTIMMRKFSINKDTFLDMFRSSTVLYVIFYDLTCFVIGTGTNACYIEKLENVELWDGDNNEPKQVRKHVQSMSENCIRFYYLLEYIVLMELQRYGKQLVFFFMGFSDCVSLPTGDDQHRMGCPGGWRVSGLHQDRVWQTGGQTLHQPWQTNVSQGSRTGHDPQWPHRIYSAFNREKVLLK